MAQSKRVSGRATHLVQTAELFGVQYHRTVVAYKRADKPDRVVLNSGGWRTATTKLRMNQFANEYCGGAFNVHQIGGEWFVRTQGGLVEFYDFMEVPV